MNFVSAGIAGKEKVNINLFSPAFILTGLAENPGMLKLNII